MYDREWMYEHNTLEILPAFYMPETLTQCQDMYRKMQYKWLGLGLSPRYIPQSFSPLGDSIGSYHLPCVDHLRLAI